MPGALSEFAKSRGFHPDELARYDIRAEGGHIIIPVLGRNGAWYERQRCDQGCHPKYQAPKGEPSRLYNPLGLGPHSPEVWIAEGELDTLSLIVAGAPAVGVLGTQSFDARKLALLYEGAEIVIAFDSDEAGESQAERLAQLWPAHQVSRFDPAPYGDVNEWMVNDRDGFIEAVQDW